MKEIAAAAFKAKCLALLDEVAETGESWTILKRGKPVARLVPPASPGARYPQDTLRGSVEVVGDIIAPAVPVDTWEAEATGKP